MQNTNLLKVESEILEKWEKESTRLNVKEHSKGKKIFFFLEGPPYANGDLHMGHARGYIRKDTINRYKWMNGFDVFDRAGFDVHGLPIENKVEKTLGIKSKREIETLGVEKFLSTCISTYSKYVKEFTEIAKKYGTWLDFENAYIPATPSYIDKSWKVFKSIYDKNLVYQDSQVMPFCFHCGTVLAKGPEVEEEEDTDPSVFVAFPVNHELSKPKIPMEKTAKLLVWTTTPWTLPANMAVAVNPKEMYVKAKIKGHEFILAKQRLDAVAKETGESPVILHEFFGSELEGIYYTNPLETLVPKQEEQRKHHRVLFDEELVNMQDGTGIVHIAPAYGPEDFALSKKEKVPVFSIVGHDGTYLKDAGQFAGLHLIHEANRAVEEELTKTNSLIAKTSIRHSYPHCWRCHDKLIYMPTKQWYINIAKLKKKILKQMDKVEWHPKELKDWFTESIVTAPDWVISRQRYWGIPIPIWKCSKCEATEAIGSFEELKQRSGKGLEFTSENLHRPTVDNLSIKCSSCGNEMHRIRDIFDVWYDSGVAHTASLSTEEFNKMYGKAFVTEGPDQIRGWFATLMKTGVAAYGKTPFNTIVMQGWVLDEKGEAMHKSKGNYIAAYELLGKHPIDAVRLFTLSHAIQDGIKFSFNGVQQTESTVVMLHNIASLLNDYSASIGYKLKSVKKPKDVTQMDQDDAYIVSRLNTLIQEMTQGFETYEIDKAATAFSKFLIEDFSRFYLKIAKKKILFGDKKSAKATINVINYVLHTLLLLAAPIMPFNSEYLYSLNYGSKSTIFLEKWPKARAELQSKEIEEQFEIAKDVITAILNSREKAGARLRWPIMSAKVELNSDAAVQATQRLAGIIESYSNAKRLEISRIEGVEEEIKPLYAKLGPEFKADASIVAQELSKANPSEVLGSISKSGYYTLHTAKGPFTINENHFVVQKKAMESDAALFAYGKVSVDTTISSELKQEGLLREFERRVQMMRKELNLKKPNRISLGYLAGEELKQAISQNAKSVKKNIGALKLIESIDETALVKEFDIEGDMVKISVKKEK